MASVPPAQGPEREEGAQKARGRLPGEKAQKVD